MPVEIGDDKCPMVWGVPLDNLRFRLVRDIMFLNECAGDTAREFFSSFFRKNPTIGAKVKGLDDEE